MVVSLSVIDWTPVYPLPYNTCDKDPLDPKLDELEKVD